MRARNSRTGVSNLLVAAALVVVIVAAGALVFLTRGSSPPTSTQSASSTTLPNVPVKNEVNQFIQDFTGRNVDGLVAFYAQSSTLVWSGNVGGLAGLYSPVGNIRLIYATTVGKSIMLNANVSNYAEKVISPSVTNTTFTITMIENSTQAGIVHATINVTQEWVWGSGVWQITKENWAYAKFDSSYIDAGKPSATTFPQWGYAAKGGNPNLVSEKSFEWHAGPYVAASVYAFLFGLVALVAIRFRSRL